VLATSFSTIVSEPFASTSSIAVFPTVNGTYFYQLDLGPQQTSNVFENGTSGIHIITVFDQNVCSSPTTAEVLIIDYPKFFTPNDDGFNDTWNIDGLLFQSKSKIFIFDSYGKLLKQIVPFSSGWDGTYNGNNLPSTDYWFTVDFEYNNTKLQFKSHFSLKR